MWELDHQESWVLKNWCFPTVMLKKTLESPLDCKKIKPVYPKGNQPWIFIGRTDAGTEASILWPPDVKSHLIGKDPDAGKDWRQEEKGTTEDEMVGWDPQLNGPEFEQALGVGNRREAWGAAVNGVSKSWTWLSNWTTIYLAALNCSDLHTGSSVVAFYLQWFASLLHMMGTLCCPGPGGPLPRAGRWLSPRAALPTLSLGRPHICT